jgi:osmotically-inducible protein OsmY
MPGWSARDRVMRRAWRAARAATRWEAASARPASAPLEEIELPARIVPYLAVGAALLGLGSLTSCVVPLVAGGAATTGYVAGQERGVNTQFSDASLKASINDRWARYSSDMQRQLSLSVYDGRVLITGTVSNPEWKTEAVRLAWEVNGVKEVNSEIELAANAGIGDTARDEMITTRLRSAILFDSQIRSVNYTIDTVNGSVYLSGSARSQGELDKVTSYARNIPNVKRVVSYVRIRSGEPSPPSDAAPAPTPSAAPPAPNAPPAAPENAPTTPTNPNAPSAIEVQPLQ